MVIREIDWEEFDLHKNVENGDPRYFSFKDWEIDFMVKEINTMNPEISEIKVLRAILACCETVKVPFPKIELYECLMRKINVQ